MLSNAKYCIPWYRNTDLSPNHPDTIEAVDEEVIEVSGVIWHSLTYTVFITVTNVDGLTGWISIDWTTADAAAELPAEREAVGDGEPKISANCEGIAALFSGWPWT